MLVLRDVFDSSGALVEVAEGSKGRDGVLGVVEGVFFVCDVPSRNGRKYPRKLWERVINSPEVRKLLQNRLMFGTVGHDDLDLDALVRERKVSHLVTDLWIGEDGKGYGRAEILDTPVGRVLYTLLKNGSKLAISSKGWGEYKGVDKDGAYIVNEDTYMLERFDFVVDPGFLQAIPELKEEYEKIVRGGKKPMNEEVVKMLVKEKTELQEKLLEMTKRITELEALKVRFDSLLEVLEKWFGVTNEEEVKEAIAKIGKLVERVTEKVVKKYDLDEDKFKGKDITEVLEKLLSYLYVKSGLSERFEGKEVISGEKVFSDVKEKGEAFDICRRYYRRKLFEMREEIDRLRKLLLEARRKLLVIESLGGVDKLVSVLRKAEKVLKTAIQENLKKEAQKLSAKYGKSEQEVMKLIERFGVKEAERLLKPDTKFTEATSKVIVVGDENVKYWEKSLGTRLIEKFK